MVLTGYGNIATAVSAVKLGAFDFLAKPADADEIHAALAAARDARPQPPENPMSADRVRWEHIQRVYELCSRNVSETARRLGMHRRTLQRILAQARAALRSAAATIEPSRALSVRMLRACFEGDLHGPFHWRLPVRRHQDRGVRPALSGRPLPLPRLLQASRHALPRLGCIP